MLETFFKVKEISKQPKMKEPIDTYNFLKGYYKELEPAIDEKEVVSIVHLNTRAR